jgi:hypothetical protein
MNLGATRFAPKRSRKAHSGILQDSCGSFVLEKRGAWFDRRPIRAITATIQRVLSEGKVALWIFCSDWVHEEVRFAK